MNRLHDSNPQNLGHRWATISPKTAAVLRERRIQLAVDPVSGQKRITVS